jgi:SH3-like domain-containing protein
MDGFAADRHGTAGALLGFIAQEVAMRRRQLITVASLLVAASVGAMLLIPAQPGTPSAAVVQPQTEAVAIVHPSVDDASMVPVRLPVSGADSFVAAPAKPLDAPITVAMAQPVAPIPAAINANDRIGASAVNLRTGPATSAGTVRVLAPGEAVQVGETQNGWTQVTLADGSSGWMYSSYLASNAAQLAAQRAAKPKSPRAVISGDDGDLEDRSALVADALPAYSRPGQSSPAFTLEAGQHVRISAVRGDWLRVETEDGDSGWIRR